MSITDRWKRGGRVLAALLLLVQAAAPATLLLLASPGEAEARPRSSGGYSRPSSSSRTPSFSRSSPSSSGSYGGGSSSRRTPSSGGYSLPGAGGGGSSYSPFGGSSAGDRSYGRSQAGDALRRMREQQDSARRQSEEMSRPRTPSTRDGGYGGSYGGSTGGWWPGGGTSGGYRGGSAGGYGGGYGDWYRGRGWQMPGGMMGGPRSFGVWDAAFLWFLFSTLSQPGHSDFFRNHQDDPGYREWRQEAERRAQGDADIRARLDELDRRVQAGGDAPRDPNYLPPDVPAEVATGQAEPDAGDVRTPSIQPVNPQAEGGGIGPGVIGVVLVGGGVLGFLAWRRRRGAGTTTGGGAMSGGTMGTLRSGAEMLRHKASGEGYTPSQFRVGMTLTLDPTPFLLASGATHLQAPAEAGQTVSVSAVGRMERDALVRLYLPGDNALIQIHLGAGGQPDECRYFAPLDEVAPADEAEWGAWLDSTEGMIGWPEFQAKDGKVYARVWSPGSTRVAPRALEEVVETAEGSRTVRSQAMLYGAPTGLAAPAPATEYILVSAVEDGAQAWVEIRCGIDVNPASLSLA